MSSKHCTNHLKANTGIFSIFSSQPLPLRSKTRLENKESTVISSKFGHFIQQNNENIHDNIKFLSVCTYNGIASECNATTDSFTSTNSVFSKSYRWYSETHIYTVKAHCVNTTGIAVVCHTAVGVFSSLTVVGITAEDNTVKYSRVKPLASGAEQSRAEQIVVEHHPV